LEIPLIKTDNPAIELLWHKERIQHLLKTNQAKKAMALAISHNLQCPGTSYVAWDEAEKVQIAYRFIEQPCTELRQVQACSGGACDLSVGDSGLLGTPPQENLNYTAELTALVQATGLPQGLQQIVLRICFSHTHNAPSIPDILKQWCVALTANHENMETCFELCRQFVEAHFSGKYQRTATLKLLGELELLHAFECEK
ncbi:MAG: hypothetical protein IPP19_10055, partial [Verrucomicrobia bacterium]|nr:hypothetical protein [Verrucomicrobiota bacterium]